VEVNARVFAELEHDHFRSLLLGALQVDPSVLPEPQPLTTADIKSTLAIWRMAERLRGIANERLRERTGIESPDASPQDGQP
jgi:hypothetical protein